MTRYLMLLALTLFGFVFTASPVAETDLPPIHAVATQWTTDSLELVAFLTRVQGVWVESGIEEGENPLVIEIDPRRVEQNQARIYVSEYCKEGVADYLHFELQAGKLVFVGASDPQSSFDLCRILYIQLQEKQVGEKRVLEYESQETEHAHHLHKQLERVKHITKLPVLL